MKKGRLVLMIAAMLLTLTPVALTDADFVSATATGKTGPMTTGMNTPAPSPTPLDGVRNGGVLSDMTGTTGTNNGVTPQMNRNNVVNPGMNTYTDNDGVRTRNVAPGTNVRSNANNYRARAANNNNPNWGWLGLIGLFGLAGMMGRNRERGEER